MPFWFNFFFLQSRYHKWRTIFNLFAFFIHIRPVLICHKIILFVLNFIWKFSAKDERVKTTRNSKNFNVQQNNISYLDKVIIFSCILYDAKLNALRNNIWQIVINVMNTVEKIKNLLFRWVRFLFLFLSLSHFHLSLNTYRRKKEKIRERCVCRVKGERCNRNLWS